MKTGTRLKSALAEGLRASGCEFEYLPGEVLSTVPRSNTLKDALGREWQCGTIQVDPNLPERLDAELWVKTVAVIAPSCCTRAILGSLRRFGSILIEHHSGALPGSVQVFRTQYYGRSGGLCESGAKAAKSIAESKP